MANIVRSKKKKRLPYKIKAEKTKSPVQCYVLKHISPKKKKPPNVPKVIADWFETDSTFSFSENLRKVIQLSA
jgi:hypothetical protein